MNNLALAMKWREELEEGEFIETWIQKKSHLSFYNSISQTELDLICTLANSYWKGINSSIRITNQMGEIIKGVVFSCEKR